MSQRGVVREPNPPYLLRLNLQALAMTDTQFARLCHDNPDMRLELTAQHTLVIMSPTGAKTGWRNSRLNQRLATWAEHDGTGLAFDSSTGFTLPNGARRSPDAAWLRRERWDALSDDQQDGLAPVCPDFVVELRSPEDRLSTLQAKMREYLANAAQLGWLLDPSTRRVYMYRPQHLVEVLEDPETLPGDPILPGFALQPREIW